MNALSNRNFVAYFAANTVSFLGTWVQKVALGWLAWQVTGSVFWTSLISIAMLAPVGVLGPLIAVLAESWNMRRAFLAVNILVLGVSFLVYLLELLDRHSLETLVALSVALGLLSAMHNPVRLVFITIVVPRPCLPSAIGISAVAWNLSGVAGPAISGFALAGLGLADTLGIALLCKVPMIAVLAVMPLQPRTPATPGAGKFLGKLLEGGRVALRTPVIFTALCMSALSGFFVRGVLEIQPAVVGEVFGGDSRALAAVTAAAGLGALLASAWAGLGRPSPETIRRLQWPMLALGLSGTSLLGAADTVLGMGMLFVVTGFAATAVGIGAQTLIQLEVGEDYRARVMTWWSSVSLGSLSIGGIAIGFLGDLMPVGGAILLAMAPGGLLALYALVKLPLAGWSRQREAAKLRGRGAGIRW